jgi:Domain of unknown function (DUF1854)
VTQDPKSSNWNQGPRVRRIERTDAGELVVHLEGTEEPIREAAVARCFPWSVPDCYVSVRNKDGKEVALLDTLDELDEDSRQVASDELRERIFNPKIQRIIDFNHEFGITTITADTDRGQVSFQVRTRDDVRSLSPTRALFRDVDGNTYELPDLTALDAASQRHLQSFF